MKSRMTIVQSPRLKQEAKEAEASRTLDDLLALLPQFSAKKSKVTKTVRRKTTAR